MSDLTQEPGLTERLAAKLEAKGFVQFDAVLIGHKAHTVLPLLLSEPELVASLPDEVRRSVLTPRERVYLRLGRAEMALERECCYVPGKDLGVAYQVAFKERKAALKEARALTPEVGNAK